MGFRKPSVQTPDKRKKIFSLERWKPRREGDKDQDVIEPQVTHMSSVEKLDGGV